jgi:hypothetical protein
MSDGFRFVMISAMYENGGNTTHRLLDGHPELFVYPYESQPGTRMVNDHLSSMFPVKYRWPRFDLSATTAQDYEAIIDEECKVRTKTPHVSKFRHQAIDLCDKERKACFVKFMEDKPRTRGNLVEAFYRATFEAWKDYNRSGRESVYVGYSPIIGVDGDKIVRDLEDGHVLHVVRNPWSCYAETKKRPVPLSLAHYLTGWTTCQYHALMFRDMYPDNVHILRYEDIITDPQGVLGGLCEKLGLESADSLTTPSWNGEELKEVYPWGTIRIPTSEVNLQTAQELDAAETAEVRTRATPYLDALNYRDFL